MAGSNSPIEKIAEVARDSTDLEKGANAINNIGRNNRQSINPVGSVANKNNLTIRSIAFSSVAEAGIPISKKGKVLLDAIPWYDHRTQTIRNNLSIGNCFFSKTSMSLLPTFPVAPTIAIFILIFDSYLLFITR